MTEPMGTVAGELLQAPLNTDRKLAWFIIHTYSGYEAKVM